MDGSIYPRCLDKIKCAGRNLEVQGCDARWEMVGDRQCIEGWKEKTISYQWTTKNRIDKPVKLISYFRMDGFFCYWRFSKLNCRPKLKYRSSRIVESENLPKVAMLRSGTDLGKNELPETGDGNSRTDAAWVPRIPSFSWTFWACRNGRLLPVLIRESQNF